MKCLNLRDLWIQEVWSLNSPSNPKSVAIPTAQVARHTILHFPRWTKRVGRCDEERPKLVGQKPGRSSCSQNALAGCQRSSVPKLIRLPGARTSFLGWKTRLMVLGWLQSSAGNCIAALPCETAASDWATNFFSAADNIGVSSTEMDTRTQGLCPGDFLLCCGLQREKKRIATSFPFCCWGCYCNFNIPLVMLGWDLCQLWGFHSALGYWKNAHFTALTFSFRKEEDVRVWGTGTGCPEKLWTSLGNVQNLPMAGELELVDI